MELEARWVRHHHERFDGAGYPDGLAGEEIPLESRIILVADAFEAMTSDRPYRQAPGQSFASASSGATRARSSTRPSSRRSRACSRAPGASGPRPRRAPPRPEAQRPRRAGRSPVSAAGMTRGAGRTGRSFSSSSRSDASHSSSKLRLAGVSGSRSRKTRSETLRSAHWYGFYTQGLLRNPDMRPFAAKSASNLVRGPGRRPRSAPSGTRGHSLSRSIERARARSAARPRRARPRSDGRPRCGTTSRHGTSHASASSSRLAKRSSHATVSPERANDTSGPRPAGPAGACGGVRSPRGTAAGPKASLRRRSGAAPAARRPADSEAMKPAARTGSSRRRRGRRGRRDVRRHCRPVVVAPGLVVAAAEADVGLRGGKPRDEGPGLGGEGVLGPAARAVQPPHLALRARPPRSAPSIASSGVTPTPALASTTGRCASASSVKLPRGAPISSTAPGATCSWR